eukprot:586885-Rhodomonas_salina.2
MVRCRGLMVWNGCVADWPISMEFFRGVVDGGLFFEVLVWFNGADCRPGVLRCGSVMRFDEMLRPFSNALRSRHQSSIARHLAQRATSHTALYLHHIHQTRRDSLATQRIHTHAAPLAGSRLPAKTDPSMPCPRACMRAGR